MPYSPPRFQASAFHCPHCGVHAHQAWREAVAKRMTTVGSFYDPLRDLNVSICSHCGRFAIWLGTEVLYPRIGPAPPPATDLPDPIKHDYVEAAAIVNDSPRGAAALLRLCIQKLCIHLGLPGRNLNADIGELVRRGLNPDVQRALDALRVIGNSAVHPLELDIRDDRQTALLLFDAVNYVAEQTITHPRKMQSLFAQLPESARNAIRDRDT